MVSSVSKKTGARYKLSRYKLVISLGNWQIVVAKSQGGE